MNDREAALIRTILLAPGDDAPRLTYADWCDDNGQVERAEFIRVQIELARLPNPAAFGIECEHGHDFCPICDGRWIALNRREQELHGQTTAGEWSGMPEEICNIPPITWNFMRGFVESIKLPTNSFLRHAAAIFAAQPVTSVRLTDREHYQDLSDYESDYPWCWSHANRALGQTYDSSPHWLPPELFLRLPGGEFITKCFGTESQARTALSAACVSYGRRLAGLPPLEPNSEPKRTIAVPLEVAGK